MKVQIQFLLSATAFAWLALIPPALAASATATKLVFDACVAPVYVQLRVAAHEQSVERNYKIETCGNGMSGSTRIPDQGFASLTFAGKEGELDVRLQLRDGTRSLAYETRALIPDAAERPMQRVGHDDGPDITISSARDTFGDLVAIEVQNEPANQVAADLARVKNLHFAGIEKFGAMRLSLNWDAIPIQEVIDVLADGGDVFVLRTGEHDYVVTKPDFTSEGWKTLFALRKTDKHDAATEAKMLELAGDPQRREDVTDYALSALRGMDPSKDPKQEVVRLRKLAALLKLRSFDPNRDTTYADALVDLALPLAQAGESTDALTLLSEANAIIERVYGPQSSFLTEALLQQAMLAEQLGNKHLAHDLLSRAVAVADPTHRPPVLLKLASVQVTEGRYDDAAATLDRVYALEPEHQRWFDETDAEHSDAISDSFEDLERKVTRKLPLDRAEIQLRHELALTSARFGNDSDAAAFDMYWLARNLHKQSKLDDAAAELDRSLHIAALQEEPPFFYADALLEFANVELAQRDYARAAQTWRTMADLRAKVVGSKHVRVALALREVAMLDMLSGQDAATQDALRDATAAENGQRAKPPKPEFAKAAKDLKDGVDADLATAIVDNVRGDLKKVAALDEPLRKRYDALAGEWEAYAETVLRMHGDADLAAALYVEAAGLHNLTRGQDSPATQHAAKRAAELSEQTGQKEIADKLRKTYSLD